MAQEETWVDRALDRAKDIPVVGRAAEWMAERRETARQEDAFWNAVDGTISTHTQNEQLKVWRDALGLTAKEWDAHTERQIQAMQNRPFMDWAEYRDAEIERSYSPNRPPSDDLTTPSISQEQRDAARATVTAAPLQVHATEQGRSLDQGMER